APFACRPLFVAPTSGPRERVARLLSCASALGQKFKSKGAGNRYRLDQAHRHRVAEPVGFTGRAADHRMFMFAKLEIIIADGSCRDEAVRAGVLKLYKQPRARHPRYASFECRPNVVGKAMRD